jgi:ribosomal protein L31
MPLPIDRIRKKNLQRKDGSWNLSAEYLQYQKEGGVLSPEGWNARLKKLRQERTNEWGRKFFAEHPEKRKEYSIRAAAKLKAAHPDYAKEQMRKFRERHPDYNRFHTATKQLGNSSVCYGCGTATKTEKHHFDYSRPLEVVFLCRDCHMKLHQKSTNDIDRTKELRATIQLLADCSHNIKVSVEAVRKSHPEWDDERIWVFFGELIGNSMVATKRLAVITSNKPEGQ